MQLRFDFDSLCRTGLPQGAPSEDVPPEFAPPESAPPEQPQAATRLSLAGDAVAAQRRRRGQVAWHRGLAAEDQVCRRYQRCGYRVVERRWRSVAGEIDLILRRDRELVFVEVKAGHDPLQAAERLSRRQQARILQAAGIYLAQATDDQGTNGGMAATTARDLEPRVDLALVDGRGGISIIANALEAA